MGSNGSNRPPPWEQAKTVSYTTEKGTVQCANCKKHLNPTRFSQTAINKYQTRILAAKSKQPARVRRSGQNELPKEQTEVQLPLCLKCSAGPAAELRCVRCRQVKSLDDFSYRQRTHPDDAHCRDCQQDVDDREADPQKAEEEEDMIDAIENGNIGSHMSRVTGSGLTTFNASRSNTGTRLETQSNVSRTTGQWQPEPSVPESITEDGYTSQMSRDTRLPSRSEMSAQPMDNNSRSVRSTSYGSHAGTMKGGSNPAWVKTGAVVASPMEKANKGVQRNNELKKHREMQAAADDDDDDDGWEL